jgi:hypothetical protein
MKRLLLFGTVAVFLGCLWFVNTRTAQAVDTTDTFERVPANCQGVTSNERHVCEFIPTQVTIQNDPTPYDQWNLIAVEPGKVTSVSCQMAGTHLFEFQASNGSKPKRNPFPGETFGNVAMCRGWINGGVGPVTMTVTYAQAAGTKKPAKK